MKNKTIKQYLTEYIKRDLKILMKKYADTDKEQKEVYEIMAKILKEGF